MSIRRFVVYLLTLSLFAFVIFFFVSDIFVGRRETKTQPVAWTITPHFYNATSTRINTIRIKVLYAVPKNRTKEIDPGWNDKVSSALELAGRFHALQFRGASKLSYDIFPEPLVLANESGFYDTTSTSFGNPKALIAVSEEIERRVMREGGDLNREDFTKFEPGEYPVMGILYEGVGAAGGIIYESELESLSEIAQQLGLSESILFRVGVTSADGFFILNRRLLSERNGPTLLYHEFAHTLGIPDQYDLETGRAYSNDIMGAGRERTIETAYLDRVFLKGMGIVPE